MVSECSVEISSEYLPKLGSSNKIETKFIVCEGSMNNRRIFLYKKKCKHRNVAINKMLVRIFCCVTMGWHKNTTKTSINLVTSFAKYRRMPLFPAYKENLFF